MEDPNNGIAKASLELAAVGIRNTASIIHDRIKTAKTNKNLTEQNSELQEIINDLLTDKAELLRVAQIYEQDLTSQKITDEDIKYITKNIFPILLHFIPDDQVKDLNKIERLLSKEMFTILQLVGFNYRRAIGEPLTNLIRNAIESKIPKPESQDNQTEIALSMLEVAKDEKSTKRFKELASLRGKDEY